MTSIASPTPTRPSNGLGPEGPVDNDEDDDMTPMMDREAAALQLSKLLKAWGNVGDDWCTCSGWMDGDKDLSGNLETFSF